MILGNNLVIYMDGNAVAAAKSCDIDFSCDVIETASASDGAYRTYIAGRKKWEVGVSYLVTNTFTGLALKVGDSVTLTMGRTVNGHVTGDRLTGTAIVKDCRLTGSIGHLATGSFKFVGTGALDVESQPLESNDPYDLTDNNENDLYSVQV